MFAIGRRNDGTQVVASGVARDVSPGPSRAAVGSGPSENLIMPLLVCRADERLAGLRIGVRGNVNDVEIRGYQSNQSGIIFFAFIKPRASKGDFLIVPLLAIPASIAIT